MCVSSRAASVKYLDWHKGCRLTVIPTRADNMPEEKGRYDDENLTDEEKESGRVSQPSPNEERPGTEKDTKFDTLDPDRPDEFGDGDRRS